MTDEKISEIQKIIQARLGIHIIPNDPIFAVGILSEIMADDFVQKLEIINSTQLAKIEEQNALHWQKVWENTEVVFKNRILKTVEEIDERYQKIGYVAPPLPSSQPTIDNTQSASNEKTVAQLKLEIKDNMNKFIINGSFGLACVLLGVALGKFLL